MEESNIILQAENLSHVYHTGSVKLSAVQGVNFSIQRGETFGLVGESGCGKTTTGRMIVKLLDVTSGQILYNGKDISQIKTKKELMTFRKKVQIIFQDPYASLNPRKKIKDIVAEGLDIHRLTKTSYERDKKVAELLDLVGLSQDLGNRYPHEFSGGQRQRIGIARALALEPEFLVCDEPISALDVSIQAQVVNLLKELQKRKGLTYLFIAHDLSMVKYISHKIGVMYKGRLLELGTAEQVYHNPIHPYTKSLLSAIPLPDPEFERERKRILYTPGPLRQNMALREVKTGHYVLCNENGEF